LIRLVFLLITLQSLWASEIFLGAPLPRSSSQALLDAPTEAFRLGDDGLPVWYWPNLPEAPLRYEVEFEVPAAAYLVGIQLHALGGTPSLGDSLVLRAENLSGLLLGERSGLIAHAAGAFETIIFADSILVPDGGGLRLSLEKNDGSHPPYLTADGDCFSGNLSTLHTGDTSLNLDRDFNLRALVRWQGVDTAAPIFQLSDPSLWGIGNQRMPLSVRARDESGIRRVELIVDDPEPRVWPLTFTAIDPTDSTRVYFDGTANLLGLFDGDDSTLSGHVEVEDSLGNVGVQDFQWTLESNYSFCDATGLDEIAALAMWPPLPGAAFALDVPLAEIATEAQLMAATVIGAQLQMRGVGSCRLLLVQDGGGKPSSNYRVDSLLLADPIELSYDEPCIGWQSVQFTMHDSLRLLQGDRVWIVQEFLSFGEDPLSCLAEQRLASEESEDTSHAWALDLASDAAWFQMEDVDLHLRASLEALRCEFELPFFADFDETFADLECWNHNAAIGSDGWRSTAQGMANSSFFQPQSGFGVADSIWDPDSLQNGDFLFVNSDAMPGTVVQQDTLFTPWLLQEGEDLQLRFLSFFAYGGAEEGQVLLREDGGDGPGAWESRLLSDDFAVASDSTIGDYPHPQWARVEHSIVSSSSVAMLQLAFVYAGNWDYGWAIDDVEMRLLQDSQPTPPWPGAYEKPVSVGAIFPNPFNPMTQIPFVLLEAGPVRVEVFNLLGQRVALLLDEELLSAGLHHKRFEPAHLAGGMYIVRVSTPESFDATRMLYLK
jgi:hypothetical protein